MNRITDLTIKEREKQELLKKYELDDKSINEFRAKIKKVSQEESDKLGKEIYDIIRKKGYDENKQFSKVEELILNGANVNYKEAKTDVNKGNTALLFCSRKSTKIATFSLLIKAGADINLTNNFGTNCCMACARHNNFEALQILVALDADINAKCLDGDNAIISAKRNNSKECFDLLVYAQAHLNNRNLANESIFDLQNEINIDSSLFEEKESSFESSVTVASKDTTLLVAEAQKKLSKFKKML